MKLLLPVLALTVLVGCATTGSTPPSDAGDPAARQARGAEDREPVDISPPAPGNEEREEGEEAVDYGDVEGVREALASALGGGPAFEEFRIEVGCLDDDAFRMLELFSNGVGLWNQESQFRLEASERQEALEAFVKHDFATMETSYGGKGDPAPEGAAGASSKKVVCRVQLDIAGVSKAVAQLYGGRQHQPLWNLAADLLEIGRGPGASGVRAASLSEGLRKVASGELAPEALLLVLHRRTEEPDPITGDKGWLVTIRGLEARGRSYGADGGLGGETALELAPEELGRVLGAVAAETPEELPTNLWSEDYVDLTMRVLGHQQTIQARQFAGMTPFTHGAMQERFERIAKELTGLAEQALTYGRPVE